MSFIARRAVRAAAVAVRPLPASRRYASDAAEIPEDTDESYPKVPNVSRQYLSPYGWQDPLLRRNIGDPVHEYDELYSMWGPDIPPIAPHIALRRFTFVAMGFVGFGFLVKYVLTPESPVVHRQYPFSGLVTELGGLDVNKARLEDESEE